MFAVSMIQTRGLAMFLKLMLLKIIFKSIFYIHVDLPNTFIGHLVKTFAGFHHHVCFVKLINLDWLQLLQLRSASLKYTIFQSELNEIKACFKPLEHCSVSLVLNTAEVRVSMWF